MHNYPFLSKLLYFQIIVKLYVMNGNEKADREKDFFS